MARGGKRITDGSVVDQTTRCVRTRTSGTPFTTAAPEPEHRGQEGDGQVTGWEKGWTHCRTEG